MFDQRQGDRMRWILFAVFVGIFAAVAGSTIWVAFFRDNWLNADDRNLIIRLFLGETALAVMALFYAAFGLRRNDGASDTLVSVPDAPSYFIKSYPRSQHPEFFAEVEKILATSSKITLIAVGLNLLWEKHIVDLLVRRAAVGDAEIAICVGNTNSPHVEDRLIEEEMDSNRPAVGRAGIDRNVKAWVERLELAGRPKNLQIRLFNNYLTFATLIFDDDIFVYPYGYQVLGNTSPIFHFKNDRGDEVRFLIENADRILRDSVPAADIVSTRLNRRHRSDEWIAAAVYVVPASDSKLYRTGTHVLGYDIREGRVLRATPEISEVRPYVGEAAAYGFHATLADALLFSNEAQIDRVRAELKFLSEEFRPFRLSDLSVSESSQDRRAIIIEATDRTGTAEALHHELVSRVYRLATSSTYLAGQTTKRMPLGDSRAQLMLERYGSQYILNALTLHLTLLAACPIAGDARKNVIDTVTKLLDPMISDGLDVEELALVTRRHGENRWVIDSTFSLCGPRGS
jgi:hypothetical protein